MNKKTKGIFVFILIVFWIVALGGFTVTIYPGITACFSKNPVFFGVEIGGTYKREYAMNDKWSVSSALYWMKERVKERPYVFANVRLADYVEAKIHKIEEFYGQDMALVLVTRHTGKTIGVVVAAKCKKGETGSTVEEIKNTVLAKHSGAVVINKLESYHVKAVDSFVRRPSLDCMNVPTRICQLVCANENFEMTILGVERVKMNSEVELNGHAAECENHNVSPPIDGVLRAPSIEEELRFALADCPCGDSDYLRDARIGMIERWQVGRSSTEGRSKDLNVEELDFEKAYVYVAVLLHNYEDEVEDEMKAIRESEKRKGILEREKEASVRAKNAAAL